MTSLPSQNVLRGKSFGIKTLCVVAAFGFGAFAATVAGLSPEKVVAGSFTTALEQSAPQVPGGSLVQVAGSEDFWLNAEGHLAAPIEPAAWSHVPASPLAFVVGDKMTISRGGAERTFKVVTVSAPFKDGDALSLRITAEDVADSKAAPVVFTVPAPHKLEAGKPRAS